MTRSVLAGSHSGQFPPWDLAGAEREEQGLRNLLGRCRVGAWQDMSDIFLGNHCYQNFGSFEGGGWRADVSGRDGEASLSPLPARVAGVQPSSEVP